MAKYKIGEIAASTGLEPFTLKYYEKEGLLAPESDKTTGYRYYDMKETGRVLTVHQLRQWGFSLKDIRALLDGLSPDELEKLCDQRVEAVQEQIDRLLDVRDSLLLWTNWQKRFYNMREKWEIIPVPPFHYWEHRETSPMEESSHLYPVPERYAGKAWAHLVARIPLQQVEMGQLEAAAHGFAQLDLPEGQPSPPGKWDQTFPGGRCLVYYFSAPGSRGFNSTLPQKGLNIVKQEGLHLNGDVYISFLPESLSEGVRMGNYIGIFPVENEKNS